MTGLFRFPQLFSRATGPFVVTCRRNFGMTAILLGKLDKNADPIQKLFVEKLQDYKKKRQAAGGGLVNATSEMKEKIDMEMQQIRKRYGEGNLDEFPKFQFQDKV